MDKNIENRYACKSYLQIPVEWDKIVEVLQAGSMAPSAGNIQNWKFVLIQDKDNREKVEDACLFQTWMSQAPVFIVVCANASMSQRYYHDRGDFFTTQSAAAAIENMLLEATNQGLGSNWVGAFDEEKLNEVLKIKSGWKVHAVLTLGYVHETEPRPFKYKLKDLVNFETFGNGVYTKPIFPLSNIVKKLERGKEKVQGEISGRMKKQKQVLE